MITSNTISRVVIIHGWADDPSKGWMGWLAHLLRDRGVEVVAPRMPDPKQPNIEAWLEEVSSVVGVIDEQTALVGHSLGTYVLLRYLDGYTGDDKLGKLILVAGFGGHERAEQGKHALPGVDFNRIRGRVNQIYNVYSDNDEIIPPAWSEALGRSLAAQSIIDPGKGHFAGLHGCDTLPSMLELI